MISMICNHVDDDTLDLQKVVFTNNLATFCSDPDANGNTEAWGAGPHWLKGEILHRKAWTYSGMAPLDGNGAPTAGFVPVAYKSNDVMWARAKWWGEVDASIADDLYVYFSAYLEGNDVVSAPVHLIPGDDGSWVMDNVSAKLSQTFAQICGQYALYNPNLQLTWKLYVGAEETLAISEGKESTARDAGMSHSCLYVTYGNAGSNPPAMPSPLYHSVVHIGCVAALGQNTEQGVFNAIWGKFAGDNICLYSVSIDNGSVCDTKPGNELYYYGIDSGLTNPAAIYIHEGINTDSLKLPIASVVKQEVITTKDLLAKKDGQCLAWVRFMQDILAVQGLSSSVVEATPRVCPETVAWIVDYNLAKASVSTTNIGPGYPVIDIHHTLRLPDTAGKHHSVAPLVRAFSNHYILKYDDNFYDPSYGWEYGSNYDVNGILTKDAQTNMARKIESYGISYVIGVDLSPIWKTNFRGITWPGYIPPVLNGYKCVYVAQHDSITFDANWQWLNDWT